MSPLDATIAVPPGGATKRLADYRVPPYLVDDVALDVRLDRHATVVRSSLRIRRNPEGEGGPLRLDGERLELLALTLDGQGLAPSRFRLDDAGLSIADVPDRFTLGIDVRHAPETNTELSGLYMSGGNFITQCEAEGFRRITFFPDRPDVMARYTVTLRADPTTAPTLLSNGNPDGAGMEGGLAWARFVDPHPKPSYLFALVAGDLVAVRDRFTTRAGRDVALAIHVRRGDEARCAHAMRALKDSMRWDEDRFGLEYDLDVFNIVAVSDFNMGAMENKGLNIFNTRYVLASPDTATDGDYAGVETVIAHEYFHNWTGNRVTCRDWFQLSLKEGLTVYRDQEFSADQGSRAVKRIAEVRGLRAGQFVEDAGPLSHPVRPETYIEINNFYTATVYRKGAEIVRMIERIVGRDAFRRGMDLYIGRHDNEAVTIEDFVLAMEDASGADLGSFRRWYATAGTPTVSASGSWDAAAGRYTLSLRQEIRTHPDAEPLVIPVALGLLDPGGHALPLRLEGETAGSADTRVLLLRDRTQDFVFTDLAAPPVASLFRGFSAPVILDGRTEAELRLLAAHDPDPFNRWDAGQAHAAGALLRAVAVERETGVVPSLDVGVLEAQASLLAHADEDPAFAATALALPSEASLGDRMATDDVDAVHAVRSAARAAIGRALRDDLLAAFRRLDARRPADDADTGAGAAGRRALKNVCLGLLASSGEAEALALVRRQIDEAGTMTDRLAALAILADGDDASRDAALAAFHARYRADDLVLGKWFAIQAGSKRADTTATVRALLAHPDFSLANPNRVFALLGSFAANRVRFHDRAGAGYALLADVIGTIDGMNSQVAARLVTPLGTWRRFDPTRSDAMRAALAALRDRPGLSRGTSEMVKRSLGG